MAGWQPIETAPKDGTKVDIVAKVWLPAFDRFEYERFPDCWWTAGDSMVNRRAHWMNVSDGWRPTHWMPRPPLPQEPSDK